MYCVIAKNTAGKFVKSNSDFNNIEDARIYKAVIPEDGEAKIINSLMVDEALSLNNAN